MLVVPDGKPKQLLPERLGTERYQESSGTLRGQFTNEFFYRFQLTQFLAVTPDGQFIGNPAFNPDKDFLAFARPLNPPPIKSHGKYWDADVDELKKAVTEYLATSHSFKGIVDPKLPAAIKQLKK